jgi:hypothetical protein
LGVFDMSLATGPDEVRVAFDAAFPWFDHERWMWSFKPNRIAGVGYRIPDAPRKARGALVIYMPGATYEQGALVRAWLVERFNPAYIVPADPQVIQPENPEPYRRASWSRKT